MIVKVNALMIHRFHASYGSPVIVALFLSIFPAKIHRLEPTETFCPECNGELDFLREVSRATGTVDQRTESEPHIAGKKTCTKCDCNVEAPAPSSPIVRASPDQVCWSAC